MRHAKPTVPKEPHPNDFDGAERLGGFEVDEAQRQRLKLAVERRNDDERVADLEALHFEAAPVPENHYRLSYGERRA